MALIHNTCDICGKGTMELPSHRGDIYCEDCKKWVEECGKEDK